MRSPADMEVIQIEITNACLHSCSNCTRFCGHHKHPFFMDWLTFQRAVDSLRGFDGIIGLMGGEPTLHPEFERMTIHLRENHGMEGDLRAGRRPVKDFMTYIRAKHNANRVLNRCKGPGLWTSMPKQYYTHYELIQDSFVFQSLNDHYNPSFHQPLLISRKDLEIPDDQWIPLRDACWIQNCWSASITPKGAFFCEVAAALDMLFDGPGGWPIMPGWWQRTPKDFMDQLHWCEMCGAAFPTARRNANDRIDDASPSMLERLRSVESPKVNKDGIIIYQPGGTRASEKWEHFISNQYIADFSQRLGTANLNLLPKAIDGVLLTNVIEDKAKLDRSIENALKELDHVVLLIAENHTDETLPAECQTQNERFRILSQKKNSFGMLMNKALQGFSKQDWVLLSLAGQVLPIGFRADLQKTFINPGVFYTFNPQPDPRQSSKPTKTGEVSSNFYLFNQRASALRQAGFDGVAHCADAAQFQNLWSQDKRITVTTLLENLPPTDEEAWMGIVDRHVLEDEAFCGRVALVMSQAAPGQGNILITQSASYFLTRALTRLLMTLGYTVCLLTHERFAIHFKDILSSQNMITFNCCEMIKYDPLYEQCSAVKSTVSFEGAVVPYSSPFKIIVPEDGYQDIEKMAEYMAGRIVCRVNIKREFVSGHADHRIVHDNRWRY